MMHMKVRTILLAGLLVGTLDILSAFVDYYIASGKGPEGLLRYIASGVFGMEAFTGPGLMAFWGLFFHYVIAYSLTVFFFWIYPKSKFMPAHPILTGILFGIFAWVVTAQMIVPLSNTPPVPFVLWKAFKAIAILIAMIGLPLSYITRKAFLDV